MTPGLRATIGATILAIAAGCASSRSAAWRPDTGWAGDPQVAVVDTLTGDLIVVAENGYQPSRDWAGLTRRLAAGSPGLLEQTFDVFAPAALTPYVEDLHRRVSAGLAGRLARGDLRTVDWGLTMVLHVTVESIDLRAERGSDGGRVGRVTMVTRCRLLDQHTGDAYHDERIRISRTSAESPVRLGDLVDDVVSRLYRILREAHQPDHSSMG